jgi:hypothetical protein
MRDNFGPDVTTFQFGLDHFGEGRVLDNHDDSVETFQITVDDGEGHRARAYPRRFPDKRATVPDLVRVAERLSELATNCYAIG